MSRHRRAYLKHVPLEGEAMKIIVDAMGGDNAPVSCVKGALAAVREDGTAVILVGRGEEILTCLKEEGVTDLPPGLEIVHADEVVEMSDDPATAFRVKKNSSLTVGLELLQAGRGDAFVSAGSTGAVLSAATLLVKRVRGIRRAALAPVVPTGNGGTVLIDCGANAECTPEYLLQFACMGSYYASRVLGRPEPRVGLLNIGTEENKGTALQRETYRLLREAHEAGLLCFAGNVEGRDAVLGAVDVLVADGYSGNIFLKTVEGTGMFMAGAVKTMFKKNMLTKLAALLVSSGIRDFKKLLDSREVGGTALLGITKPVIKAHGSSDDYAMRSAIRQAVTVAASGISEDIEGNIEHMRLPQRSETERTE